MSLLILAAILVQAPPPVAMPGLNLPIVQLRTQYQHYGVGKRLKPRQWLGEARVALALSFDVD